MNGMHVIFFFVVVRNSLLIPEKLSRNIVWLAESSHSLRHVNYIQTKLLVIVVGRMACLFSCARELQMRAMNDLTRKDKDGIYCEPLDVEDESIGGIDAFLGTNF